MINKSVSCKCYVNLEEGNISPCAEAKDFMWEVKDVGWDCIYGWV